MRVVEARSLVRTFRRPDGKPLPVLRGVNLLVREGESVAITGPSGAGKSTLLHLLGALERPTEGEVWLGEEELSQLSSDRVSELRSRYIGFVFQFHHLLRDLTALENVLVPLLVSGKERAFAAERAMHLLDQVGLADRAEHRPRRLSGGEQQRVSVARAMANSPALLLADEPSGNLDAKASEQLHDLLFELVTRSGTALVLVTHGRELAERAERVMRLEWGELNPLNYKEGVWA